MNEVSALVFFSYHIPYFTHLTSLYSVCVPHSSQQWTTLAMGSWLRRGLVWWSVDLYWSAWIAWNGSIGSQRRCDGRWGCGSQRALAAWVAGAWGVVRLVWGGHRGGWIGIGGRGWMGDQGVKLQWGEAALIAPAS